MIRAYFDALEALPDWLVIGIAAAVLYAWFVQSDRRQP